MFRHGVMYGLFCLLVVFAVSCDDDCPTCPPPPPEPVSDYDVYLAGFSGRPMYVYNTKEMAVKDSLDFGDLTGLHHIAVSGDGRHFMITIDNDVTQGFKVFDLATGDTVKTHEFGDWIEVSNSGNYIALMDLTHVYFLNGLSYEILFTETINARAGRFLCDDSKFYCITDNYYIRIYDMASQTLDTVFRYYDDYGDSPTLYNLQPDQDGTKIYLIAGYTPTVTVISAYDLSLDSTTLYYRIGPPGGDIRLTPDGSQVIYTDPGEVMIDQYGSMHVIYIDPESDAIISLVDAAHSIQSDLGFIPGLLAITPDSRYSIVTCAGGCPVFGIIDNIEHRFVDIFYDLTMPQTKSFVYVTCRKSP
jgi:hypothetical protein